MPSTDCTLLKVGEVADRLRCSIGLVYKLAANGQLPVIRIGNAIRIDADDLADYLAERNGGSA